VNFTAELERAAPILVVAAHPDDEVIGIGGHLASLCEPVIVHLTDGAPRSIPDRESYAATRSQELARALALAGIGENRACVLGAVDQESSFALVELTVALEKLIAEFHPAVVVTHPYEGGHPDHDAAAFIVAAAVRRHRQKTLVIEFTSYHNRTPEAALPELEVGTFLANSPGPVDLRILSPEARERKRRLFDCFESQQHMLVQFPVNIERFRVSPAYDFGAPPHSGMLFYEDKNWGLTGEEWRRLARQALHDLKLRT